MMLSVITTQVKGDVFLMVQAPTTATGLFLRVRGSEKTYYTERRHRDSDVSRREESGRPCSNVGGALSS